ncbi:MULTISPECIES: hypothetical protein [unclassified Curtobacterium]|uniref:hypothetical protein n=1 Tax=unclassified Curtobacterium TaxID=257496 RepID=UPI00226B8B96|nr:MULTISPECIES: hypothetical protein [unclassified Curtobacterium]
MRMFSLGWRAFRDHVCRSVPADRRRRATRIGALVAALALAALVIVGSVAPWLDLGEPLTWVGIVLLAIAVGLVGVAAVPLRPRSADGSRVDWSGGLLPAPDDTERYFRTRSAPTIPERDRDQVLRHAEAARVAIVPELWRSLVLIAASLVAFGAVVMLDLPGRVVLWVAVSSAAWSIAGARRLGRVERAGRLAESLPSPEVEPQPHRRDGSLRSPTPRGTKLGLPED